MRIIESPNLLKFEIVETERSRKRRHKKPWAKKKVIVRSYPDTIIYQSPEGLICHPVVAKELRSQLEMDRNIFW